LRRFPPGRLGSGGTGEGFFRKYNNMSELSTSSIGEVCVALREDVSFRQQHYGGQSCYVIEDPTSTRFFRIGVAEYTLISLFDGTRSISDAMHTASSVLGPEAFTEHDVANICQWLVENGLAKTNTASESQRFEEHADKQTAVERQQWMNPIMAKLPFFCPEPWLDRIAPWLLWTTSWWAFCVWGVVVLTAAYQLFSGWGELDFNAAQIISSENWLMLGVTWIALKLVHESAHALFCRKYDGEVRDAGVVLIALAPIFYVDVTSSWRFPSKWQRIAVAAAGMYAEIFIGAVAALIWIHSEPGVIQQCALNVALLSTVTTILFNANPLMRFDGYYILSDWLEIPNLAPQGQEYLSYLGRRYLYGVELKSPFERKSEGWIVRLYGVLAKMWQILITISIALMAATIFHGAGLALVIAGLAFWIFIPVFGHLKYFVFGRDREQPNRLRFMTLGCLAAVCIYFACVLSPWPFSVKAPAIVDYAPRGVVRAGVSGFVKTVLVKPGEYVQANQLLGTLENVELTAELQRLTAAVEASRTRQRIAGAKSNVTDLQLEFETTQDLQRQLTERTEQLDRLAIRAPMAGQVVSDELDSKVGTFLSEGDEFIIIGNEHTKELVVSIAQEDAELFHSHVGQDVDVRLRGGGRERLSLGLGRVEPNASTIVEHFALCAAGGGTVAVRPVTLGKSHAADDSWEFVEPRLIGSIGLPADVSEQLNAGQLAMVKLPITRSTLGQGIYRAAERWVRNKWKAIEAAQRG